MGIYTNMLRESEEFMGNTGFDSDLVVGPDDEYTQSLADIEKATVDEINAEYAEESEQKELDGQDLESNPMEEAAIAIYESERNWNMILKAMGQHELQEATRGREVVMEAVDVKGWLGKIKQFFVDLWKKVSDTVSKWAGEVKGAINKQKSKVDEKFYNRVREGFAKYDGKGFKGIEFDVNEDLVNEKGMNDLLEENKKRLTILSNAANTAAINDTSFANAADDASTTISDDTEKKEYIEAMKDDFKDSMKKAVLNDGKGNVKECAKPDYVINILKNGLVKDLAKVMSLYGKVRKSYSDIIKVLNKIEKQITKENKKLDQKIPSINKQITNQKQLKQIEFRAMTITMRKITARYRQCRKIANVYAAASLKKDKSEEKKSEPQNASYTGFFAGLQMI